ncbi:hydantoinase/oxoprolinase family protein [Sinorhizobium fredii]|uniref:Hydantoinase A/oxoprolinase protein n=1 Tax=Rhizobium fredii TaxID=380 RepID=A0A2L0HAK3_RHIFR|nr:hydantoinase/oxoprolinase family protein [Sinorhizobium fredii]AUX78464.1 hydantoinase A/oxoprolinase protein [Sinorhizobium fredii]
MRTARIGTDIGGTFTDLVLLDNLGQTFFAKVSSTPSDPGEAVLTGVKQLLEIADLDVVAVTHVLHGTTVGSNTLLQQQGAKCGLLTTRGFRDILEIGRLRTPVIFDLQWDKPDPLVARRYRVGVGERMSAQGEVLSPVDRDEILKAGEFFKSECVESVAICFLNSYRNSENELAAEAIFREAFPDIWVTTSVSVLPEIREYERTSTTAVNAYVLPSLRKYLQRLESGLRGIGINAPLLVSNSNGGLATAPMAQEKPVFFITSGRAAGVVGAGRLGSSVGMSDLIAFDMGGTTASASLVQNGKLTRSNEYEFRAGISTPSRFIKAGGYLMRVPNVDVAEVGSGAGSIAAIDQGGLLHVGPTSAGADPGPACYGIGGTKPTVTDANVVLGYLPSVLAGGQMKLDVEAARRAIASQLADPLGLDVEAAAVGVREVANANMARAIRAVTVERGVDPRDFTLLAFGGSGPVHACDLARMLGIKNVLFPRAPGVFTAMGMLAGNVERHFIRALPGFLHALDTGAANSAIDDLAEQAYEALKKEGYDRENISLSFELDLRFRGQDSEVPIQIPAKLSDADQPKIRQDFLDAYIALYGYASTDQVETVNIRLSATVVGDILDFKRLTSSQFEVKKGTTEHRKVYFSREIGWVETPIIDRASFRGEVEGPAILQSPDSTIVVPPGAKASLDAAQNITVSL